MQGETGNVGALQLHLAGNIPLNKYQGVNTHWWLITSHVMFHTLSEFQPILECINYNISRIENTQNLRVDGQLVTLGIQQ